MNSNNHKVSCIVPAFNEEKGIGNTLAVLTPMLGEWFSEIIVVNDGSKDRTEEIVKRFTQVTLLNNEKNIGKSASVARGIEAASGDYCLLLDADLLDLNRQNIIDLHQPVLSGQADVTMVYIRNAWPLPPFKKIDYCSGIRLLPKALLSSVVGEIGKLPGYGLEVFLNKIIIKERLRLAVVSWPNVGNELHGVFWSLRIWLNVLQTVSLFGAYRQNLDLLKLLVPVRPSCSLIIPAYNEEKYIRECLQSIADNARADFDEIIVVDNASTDKTSEIAKSFDFVRVVREERKGLTWARARGAEETKGQILVYIDADTRVSKNWSQKILKEFSDPRVSALSGPGFYYDMSKITNFFVGGYWLVAWLHSKITGKVIYGANFALRRCVLMSIGGFDKSIEFYGEDTNLARRIAAVGKVKFRYAFMILTSGRRFKGEGLIKTALTYIKNYVWELVFNRPATIEYQDHR